MGLAAHGPDTSGLDTLSLGGPNTRITSLGTAWFCLVAAIMAGSAVYFTVLSYRLMRGNRFFHRIAAVINIISAYSYAGMALNWGYSDVSVPVTVANEALLSGVSRQFFYIRYFDWFSTTSLIFAALFLTARAPWSSFFIVMISSFIMHTGYNIAANIPAPGSSDYFVLATVARLFIAIFVLWEGMMRAFETESYAVIDTCFRCTCVTLIVWLMFPFVFVIADGNIVSADVEAILYGVLDIFAKPVFSALLISSHRDIDPSLIGFVVYDYPKFFGGARIVKPDVPEDNDGKT